MNDLDRSAGGVSAELEDLGDRFDQCDGRNLNFERCSQEAHHGGACLFPSEVADEWPGEHVPPDPL